MTQPAQRLQLSRRKGFRLPLGAKSVARPSKYGNPYRVSVYHSIHPEATDIECRRMAVDDFRRMLDLTRRGLWHTYPPISELAGLDLACWCSLPEPGEPDICHAAVLIERANGPAPSKYWRANHKADGTLCDDALGCMRCTNECEHTNQEEA